MLGKNFRITQQRGVVLQHEQYGEVLATYHPSALLRMPDRDARQRAYDEFVTDLKILAKYVLKKRRAVHSPHANAKRKEHRASGV